MNYESMSDHRINALVTSSIFDCNQWEYSDAEFYHCGMDGEGYYSQPILDYCNDWSFGGPIIQKHKLSVMLDWELKGHYTAMGTVTEQRSLGSYDKLISFSHKEPLRAAMIVFLMMNEGEL